MALRGKPSLRGPLGALFVLNLCGGFAASCGEPQDPSFRAVSTVPDDATRLDERQTSADAVVANPESLDMDKLKERAEELGVDLEEEMSELEDLSDTSYSDSNSGSGNQTAGNDSSGNNTSGSDASGNDATGSDGSSGSGTSDDLAANDPVTPGSEDTPTLPADSSDDQPSGSGSSDDNQTAGNDGSSSSDDDSSSGNDSGSGGTDSTAGNDDSGSGSDDSSSGSGNEMPPTFELYSQDAVQPEVRPVDILWVIDSSGSMAEEQNYLAQNFDSMVNALVEGGASFQTAVTTTDICQQAYDARCPVDYGGSAETRLRGRFVEKNGAQVLRF